MFTDEVVDFNVCTVSCAQCYPHPFNMNFMFPVPDASLEAREICSEISQAGIIFSAMVTL